MSDGNDSMIGKDTQPPVSQMHVLRLAHEDFQFVGQLAIQAFTLVIAGQDGSSYASLMHARLAEAVGNLGYDLVKRV